MQIQEVDSKTRDAVRQLMYTHLSARQVAEYKRYNPQAHALNEDLLNRREGYAIAAVEDGQVIGYLLGGERLANTLTELRFAEVYEMRVADAFQRHGVGTALLQEFFRWARQKGFRRVTLEVSPRNKNAIRFYTKNHMKPSATIMEKLL